MNWIERMYELNGRDLYSQNGEGLYLEYLAWHLPIGNKVLVDIGAGDGFYLSSTKHLAQFGWQRNIRDRITGEDLTLDTIEKYISPMELLSIDIDGNDYWILDKILSHHQPPIVITEFNSAFDDARTIKYNPDHAWDGTDYFGFSFKAGEKLADKHGYKVIFQIANMNMIMVRTDLIKVSVPPVTYVNDSPFEKSNRTDWVHV